MTYRLVDCGESRVCGWAKHMAPEQYAHDGAHGHSVYHGEGGLVHRLQRLRHPVDLLPELILVIERAGCPLAHAADVAAGAERASASGDDDHVDVVVALGLAERPDPRVDHGAG